jgi:hypothetical protein
MSINKQLQGASLFAPCTRLCVCLSLTCSMYSVIAHGFTQKIAHAKFEHHALLLGDKKNDLALVSQNSLSHLDKQHNFCHFLLLLFHFRIAF